MKTLSPATLYQMYQPRTEGNNLGFTSPFLAAVCPSRLDGCRVARAGVHRTYTRRPFCRGFVGDVSLRGCTCFMRCVQHAVPGTNTSIAPHDSLVYQTYRLEEKTFGAGRFVKTLLVSNSAATSPQFFHLHTCTSNF